MHVRPIGFLTLTLTLAGAVPVVAQQPPARQPRAQAQPAPAERPEPPAMAGRRMAGLGLAGRPQSGLTPEALLRMREQLVLTEAQVTRLEALRQEGVSAQRERMAAMLDLQSQLRAGRITPEQARERRQAMVTERAPSTQAPIGERARGVLTDQQRIRLAELQVEQLRRQLQVERMRGARGAPGGRMGQPGRSGIRGQAMIGPRANQLRDQIRERVQERLQGRGLAPRQPMRRLMPPEG